MQFSTLFKKKSRLIYRDTKNPRPRLDHRDCPVSGKNPRPRPRLPTLNGGANFPDILLTAENRVFSSHVCKTHACQRVESLFSGMSCMIFIMSKLQICAISSTLKVLCCCTSSVDWRCYAFSIRCIWLDGQFVFTVGGSVQMLRTTSASSLYRIFVSRIFEKPQKPLIYILAEFLSNIKTSTGYQSTWPNVRTTFSAGSSRNVHFLMLHVASHTNNRLSNFQHKNKNIHWFDCVTCCMGGSRGVLPPDRNFYG